MMKRWCLEVESDNGYCVFNYTRDFVNKNSLKRLPASVWAIMILITSMIILGRYVYTSMFNYCSGVNRFKFCVIYGMTMELAGDLTLM